MMAARARAGGKRRSDVGYIHGDIIGIRRTYHFP